MDMMYNKSLLDNNSEKTLETYGTSHSQNPKNQIFLNKIDHEYTYEVLCEQGIFFL